MIPFPVDRLGLCYTPSSRGRAEAIQGATSQDKVALWIATASPRNDGRKTEAINRGPYDLLKINRAADVARFNASQTSVELIKQYRVGAALSRMETDLMKRSALILAAFTALGSACLVPAPAEALPVAPAPGLNGGSQAEAVRYHSRHRYRKTPQRVMGLVPGPDRRRRHRRLPR